MSACSGRCSSGSRLSSSPMFLCLQDNCPGKCKCTAKVADMGCYVLPQDPVQPHLMSLRTNSSAGWVRPRACRRQIRLRSMQQLSDLSLRQSTCNYKRQPYLALPKRYKCADKLLTKDTQHCEHLSGLHHPSLFEAAWPPNFLSSSVFLA